MSRRRSTKRPPLDYSDAPYEVGKGKTPVSTRFQKGVSGNPRGPLKRSAMTKLDIDRAIYDGLQQTVTARMGDKVVKLTKAQVIAERQINKAMEGDSKAAAFVFEKAREIAPNGTMTPISKIILEPVPVLWRERDASDGGGGGLQEAQDPDHRPPFAALVVNNKHICEVEYRLHDSELYGDMWGGADKAIQAAAQSKSVMLVPRDRDDTFNISITNIVPGGETRFRIIG